jgi:hypothetical protein
MICVLMALRRSWPQLQRSIRSVRRMRQGTLALGRIAACRFAWKGKRSMKPFATFMKEWNAMDAYTGFELVTGWLFAVLKLMIAIPIIAFFLMFALAAIFKLLKVPGVDVTGDVSFSFFAKAVGFTAITAVMFIVARAIMRVYLLVRFEEMLNRGREPEDRIYAAEVLEREIQAMISGPAPKPEKEEPLPPESSVLELACTVEFPTPDGVHVADSTAMFGPRFNRVGVDAILFQANAPGEVDMLHALPDGIMLAGGEWQPLPVSGRIFRLACVASPLLAALGTLAVEGITLSFG